MAVNIFDDEQVKVARAEAVRVQHSVPFGFSSRLPDTESDSDASSAPVPALAPRLVLPAHEAIVERPSKRIAEILEHHRHRLAAEAVGLDVADVLEAHEGGHALSVRFGKGRKSRVVPVRDDVAHLLRVYLAGTGRTLSAEGPLFRAFDDLHLDAELRDIETEILQAF